MTDYHHLRIERDAGGLTRVTFARPPANALNSQVIDDVQRCAEELIADSPRVVVLASAAPMFMAGADLTMVNAGWDELRATIGRFQRAVNTWEQVPCPTIASINGHALGAGCEIALACDFRIMARGKARIGLPEVRRGLIVNLHRALQDGAKDAPIAASPTVIRLDVYEWEATASAVRLNAEWRIHRTDPTDPIDVRCGSELLERTSGSVDDLVRADQALLETIAKSIARVLHGDRCNEVVQARSSG